MGDVTKCDVYVGLGSAAASSDNPKSVEFCGTCTPGPTNTRRRILSSHDSPRAASNGGCSGRGRRACKRSRQVLLLLAGIGRSPTATSGEDATEEGDL